MHIFGKIEHQCINIGLMNDIYIYISIDEVAIVHITNNSSNSGKERRKKNKIR